jgi:carbonic anhydrase
MEQIIDGVLRFQREVYPRRESLFQQLALGQTPEAMFIGCADSRVIPETITQQGPGSIFVVRNAGNIVPPHSPEPGGVTASIEYAVEVLGIPDIVICGHSSCGAMTAVLKGAAQMEHLPAVARWLHYADRASERTARKAAAGSTEAEQLALLIEENVLAQLENLLTHPPVKAAVERRELRVHGWVFDIGSGGVRTYDASEGRFVPISANPLAHATPVA